MEPRKGIGAIKAFFELDGGRKVEMSELTTFWKALTSEEKTAFTQRAEEVVNAQAAVAA
jgi:hypothetical protein